MASLTEHQRQTIELVGVLAANLSEGQAIRRVGFSGRSMLPMLRQRKDSVDLVKAPLQLKKYDLPMYLGSRGKYVMHRVVDVQDDCYICLGDNTYVYERVRREQIVALVGAFYRGKRRIPVGSAGYRLYCRVWCAAFPLRKCIWNAKNWMRRHLKCDGRH